MDEKGDTLWLADLVFKRENRSLKYVENGNLLLLAETFTWVDIVERMRQNAVWLSIFLISITLNALLLVMSLSKSTMHLYYRK